MKRQIGRLRLRACSVQNKCAPTQQVGWTLLEALVVVVVLGILAAIAVPAFAQFLSSQRLQGVSSNYRADFAWARSLAVQRNQTVFMQFGQAASGSCYIIFTGVSTACKCEQEAAVCDGGQEFKTVRLPQGDGLNLQAKGVQKTIRIEPIRGMVTPTVTVELTASTGQVVRHITNIMGRTRVCTPGGAALGYSAC